jgi:hypothetical protein
MVILPSLPAAFTASTAPKAISPLMSRMALRSGRRCSVFSVTFRPSSRVHLPVWEMTAKPGALGQDFLHALEAIVGSLLAGHALQDQELPFAAHAPDQ